MVRIALEFTHTSRDDGDIHMSAPVSSTLCHGIHVNVSSLLYVPERVPSHGKPI